MNTRKPSTRSRMDSSPSYKVFVSSTFLDNAERRKQVQKAINMAGMTWHGMEIFTAENRPVIEACLEYVAQADVLVGIIAHRYGWIPKGKKISITEMEYDYARERLMFLIDDSLPITKDRDFDPLPDRWKMQQKLEQFKQKIAKDKIMPARFTEEDLQNKVYEALLEWRKKH